jgi:hypothetical protein
LQIVIAGKGAVSISSINLTQKEPTKFQLNIHNLLVPIILGNHALRILIQHYHTAKEQSNPNTPATNESLNPNPDYLMYLLGALPI